MISYNVISTKPLRLEECVEGDGRTASLDGWEALNYLHSLRTGDLCGSEFINFAFERHLMMLFGEDEWRSINLRQRQQLMCAFENVVKPNYRGDPEDHRTMDFWVEDNEEAGLQDHELLVQG